ncbi:MAG: hypothetical protein AAF702_00100 [Chloroflexota bacterium]
MQNYTIEVSGPIYHQLIQQASNQNSSMDNLLEQLLAFAPLIWPETDDTTTENALMAVHRLSMIFVDIEVDHIDEILDDPMIELANADLGIEAL